MYTVISTYAGEWGRGSCVEGICVSALNLPSESDEQESKHFDDGHGRGYCGAWADGRGA